MPHSALSDGAALVAMWKARRRKERECPEFAGHNSRAHLVVLGVEVKSGRKRDEMFFASQLAKTKTRGGTRLIRRRSVQVWRPRWGSIMACAVARTAGCSGC